MRHNRKNNHLSRTSAHRKAMFSNMASSLILHKRIRTTVAKAKALRRFVEPVINRSKEVAGQTPAQATHMRRMAFRKLQDKEAVKELFGVVGPKIGQRPGGYTRILKTGHRYGDAADMCIMELVDFNENMLTAKSKEQKASRRTRRGNKKQDAVQNVENKDVKVQEINNSKTDDNSKE